MNVRARALGIAIAICGALMVVLPALPWQGASLPTGEASLSGYGAGGTNWIIPVIGMALVVIGALAVWWGVPPGSRGARVLGGIVLLWAALGVAWVALAVLSPDLHVVAGREGLPDATLAGDWAMGALPAAWACLAVAALAGMAGILLMTPRPGEAPADEGDPASARDGA